MVLPVSELRILVWCPGVEYIESDSLVKMLLMVTAALARSRLGLLPGSCIVYRKPGLQMSRSLGVVSNPKQGVFRS